MIEQVQEYIQKLLAVPYSHVFGLNKKLLNQLTEKEFFENCYVHASDGINENIHTTSEPVKTAFEIDLSTKEMLDRADEIRNDEKAFINWLETQQDTTYYVRGDAGTGKSVYLHWLKYKAEHLEPEKDWKWTIIDISQSNNSVKILDVTVQIPQFESIYYKVISAIIKSIERELYSEKILGKAIDHEKTAKRFQTIHDIFQSEFDPFYPDQIIRQFFLDLPLKAEVEKTSKQISEDCGRYLACRFEDILTHRTKEKTLELCLQIYLYVLKCLDFQTKYVVAIDNVERIIGDDEIFNFDLVEFASNLRTIQNTIRGNNECLQDFYKLVVFMRNTSVRMLTPQQITDIHASTHDMSDWFDVETIIFNKLKWYKNHGETLEASEEILNILQDNINENGNLRGLYTKITMIFNNNKRVIVHFLINIFGKESNRPYINFYNQLRNHEISGLSNSLTQFAARSIIYRLLLNEMRQDDFFHAIMTEGSRESITQNDHKNNRVKNYGTAGLGYARRILTLAYEYKLTNPDAPYMSLNDILCRLFGVSNDDINSFYSPENSEVREQIAGILFAMNYYDGRRGDWLQFIDIQYYPKGIKKRTRIPNGDKMKEILERGVEKLKVKITTAGVAYLYFIAFSYEYFACKIINSKTRNEIMGEYDIPPLLCTIPTKEEIIKTKIQDLNCIKTIEAVLIETLRCITKMNQDEHQGIDMIPFRKELNRHAVKHTVRIVNSHRGYLDNYVECLSEIYCRDAADDENLDKHLRLLIQTIQEMREYYRAHSDQDIKDYKNSLKALLVRKQQEKDSL